MYNDERLFVLQPSYTTTPPIYCEKLKVRSTKKSQFVFVCVCVGCTWLACAARHAERALGLAAHLQLS